MSPKPNTPADAIPAVHADQMAALEDYREMRQTREIHPAAYRPLWQPTDRDRAARALAAIIADAARQQPAGATLRQPVRQGHEFRFSPDREWNLPAPCPLDPGPNTACRDTRIRRHFEDPQYPNLEPVRLRATRHGWQNPGEPLALLINERNQQHENIMASIRWPALLLTCHAEQGSLLLLDARAELDIDEQGREKLVWTVFDCHRYHLQARPGDALLVKDKMAEFLDLQRRVRPGKTT